MFKDFLRVNQVPTHVWYSAYGDLTALNIAQNERIRAGLHGQRARRRAGVGAVAVKLELGDVQGLFARGYGDLKSAAFLLLKIEDSAAARRWLAETSLTITSAEDRRPEQALNVAFTSSGLGRLGLPAEALAKFSNEFVAGMTTPHRMRILGDLDENAPEHWDWGGPAAPVDAVLLLYARNVASLVTARGGADPPARTRRSLASCGGSAPPTSTASSRSASATGSRSRSSRGSASPARPSRPSRPGSSCSATRTSTARRSTSPCSTTAATSSSAS